MKTKLLTLSFVSLLLLTACNNEIDLFIERENPNNTETVTEPNPESKTPTEETNEDETVCTMEHAPVCGLVAQTNCTDTPCEPVPQTFSNQCQAEAANASDITPGPCQEPNPQEAEKEPAEDKTASETKNETIEETEELIETEKPQTTATDSTN